MEIQILGCRGSTPSTGAEFARYGGDTSAVSVAHQDRAPSLVLDAGTGLRNLANELGDGAFRGSILLTHLHWDHTHGLPFARAVDRDDAVVDLYVPSQGVDPLSLLARAMGPPHFPITPDQLRGTWRFHELEEGRHRIAGFEVEARDVAHKGGRTFGYRVIDDGASLAYIPDFSVGASEGDPTDLVSGADLLLHDSQHTDAEIGAKGFLGHSTVEHAVRLAERHDVGRLVLFHHDPARTDVEIDRLVSSVDSAVPVDAARSGGRLTVG